MRFSTLSVMAVVPATMAAPGQYLRNSAFEPFPVMELRREATEGVYEKRSDGYAPLPTGTPTVPAYPTLAVTPEEGIFDERAIEFLDYPSGYEKRDADSYPTAYVKRSEPSGYVKRSEPSGYVKREAGYTKRSEPTGYVKRFPEAGYTKRSPEPCCTEPVDKRSAPTGYVKRSEPTGYVKRSEPTGYVKRSEPSGFVKERRDEEQHAHANFNREDLIRRYYPTGYLNNHGKRQAGQYYPAPTGGATFPAVKVGEGEGVADKRAVPTGY